MKILSIVWHKVLPPVYGGQKGVALFNKYLSKHIDLACLCSVGNIADGLTYDLLPLLPEGKKQFMDTSVWKLIRDTAQTQQATHLLLEHPYHGIAAVKACHATGARLIVHSHNIESQRFRELGNPWWWLLARYERWVHRRAQLSLFKTEADKLFAIKHFGLKENACHVVPYGIENDSPVSRSSAPATIRARHGISTDEKILLFAGTLDYKPNADAVKVIYKEIAPRLESRGYSCKIIICGRNKKAAFSYLDQLKHPLVIRLSEVADMDNYFMAADLFINPVFTGGGIQTKNIEALARHCSVLAFDHMVDPELQQYAGEKLRSVIAGNWKDFVQQIPAAAGNSLLTPDSFFHHYDWDRITRELALRIAEI